MTPEAEELRHVTPEMCAVLRYTAAHGCMAKIGEAWLGPARLLERQGLLVLRQCIAGHYAAQLTPDRRGHADLMAFVCGKTVTKLG